MNQPIVFLSPSEVEGKRGFQVVDDETHEATAVILEDGTTAPDGVTYRGDDA